MKGRLLKISYFFTVLILIIIVGCQSNRTQTKKPAHISTIKYTKKDIVKRSISGSKCDSTLISNEFSNEALAFKIFKADTDKIKSLFLDTVVLKIEKQKKEQGGYYYLYNLTDGVNKIILLQDPGEGFYLEDADIKNDKVRLNKKIEIGMKEDVFLKLLNVNAISCDTVTVKNDELTTESVYIFKDAKLREILMGDILE